MVVSVPKVGMKNTSEWYVDYHSLVFGSVMPACRVSECTTCCKLSWSHCRKLTDDVSYTKLKPYAILVVSLLRIKFRPAFEPILVCTECPDEWHLCKPVGKQRVLERGCGEQWTSL